MNDQKKMTIDEMDQIIGCYARAAYINGQECKRLAEQLDEMTKEKEGFENRISEIQRKANSDDKIKDFGEE